MIRFVGIGTGENSMTKWLEEIIDVLKDLGGEASLSDIYEKIEERGIKQLTNSYKNTIRGIIYSYSSDSDYFQERKDYFYCVKLKGKGIWGLRDFEPLDNKVNLTEDDSGFPEGKRRLRKHIYRERNQSVIRKAKEKFKEKNDGKVYCEVCDFDFYEIYGKIGEDFIEGHHTIPVSELSEGHKTKVEDIALVCSNCHRMLHRKRPWLTKEQLKRLLK